MCFRVASKRISNALEVAEVRLHGKVESRPVVTIQCACCLGSPSEGILPRVWMEAGRCFVCGVFALSVSFSCYQIKPSRRQK